MHRTLAILLLGVCGVVVLVSGLSTFVFANQLLVAIARGGATALTLQVGVADDAAEPGDEMSTERAAADVQSVVGNWGWGRPRVTVLDSEAGLIRLELGVRDSPEYRALLKRQRRLELKLVERELEAHERVESRMAEGLEVACAEGGEVPACYLLNSRPVIDAADVRSARREWGRHGVPAVSVVFTKPAAARLRRFTAAHEGRRLAIVLDGKVVMAPVIRKEISDQALIEGGFSEQEARDLAFDLNSGVLPPLTVVRGEPISPMPRLRPLMVGFGASLLVLVASVAGVVAATIHLRRNART